MKVTYNWLKDFVDIDIPARELADKLVSVGFEVEEISRSKSIPTQTSSSSVKSTWEAKFCR